MLDKFIFTAVVACSLAAAAQPTDPLESAVEKRVLAKSFAYSSETLAMNALSEADIAAEFAWEAVRTPEEFKARQRELRRKFVESLGGFPNRTPLEARTTGAIERDGYRIEKIVFASQPGFYVTGNLYIPQTTAVGAKRPGLIVPCGHSPVGKAAVNYQRAGIAGARAGLVTLVYDPSDQGERIYDQKYAVAKGHNRWGALAHRLGWSFGRIRVWDAIRALDYLVSRPEVDGGRLCVSGNSGGGTLTALVMALDDRIGAAAPSCYISSLRDVFNHRFPSDSEQEQFGELSFGLNHLGYLLLRAPMPILLNCQTDDSFPYRGSQNTVAHARTVLERFGWTNRVAMVSGTGPHSWPKGSQAATMEWFRYWMSSGADSNPPDLSSYRVGNIAFCYDPRDYAYRKAESDTLPVKELFAAPGGSVTNIPGSRSVANLLVEACNRFVGMSPADASPRNASSVSPEVVSSLAGIRAAVRPNSICTVLGAETVGDIRVERLSFFTPDGAQLPAVLLLPPTLSGGAAMVCGEGLRTDRLPDAKKFLSLGRPVLLPDLTGWGELGKFRREFYGQIVPDETLAMTWYPVGRSLVGIRAENILDMAEYLKSRFRSPVKLAANGRAVIPAAHAAFVAPGLFDGCVAASQLPMSWTEEIRRAAKCNYADSVFGALKYYDWTDLLSRTQQ